MQPETAGQSISPEATVRYVNRLSPDVYRKFEDSLQKAVIDKSTSDAGADAAYKLGIQYVLYRLRQDLCVQE